MTVPSSLGVKNCSDHGRSSRSGSPGPGMGRALAAVALIEGSFLLEITQLSYSFACKGPQKKMLRIESPPSVKHLWTASTPESCSFAITRPTSGRCMQHIFSSNSLPSPFQSSLLWSAASAVNGLSVDCLV